MLIPKSALIAGIVLIGGIVLIIAGRSFFPAPDVAFTPVPTTSPLVSASTNQPQLTPSADEPPFDGFPDQGLIQSRPPQSQITGPGSCELSDGKIVFFSPTSARHENATFTYRNIDDPARLVLWRVEPDDGLVRVGPNIFSGLRLPNGSTSLTVTFNDGNHASRYTLTASVFYGVYRDGAVIGTAQAPCGGKVTVEFNY